MSRFLQFLQNFAAADKTALVAGALAALGLLAAKFGLRLNASDTAYAGVLLTGAVTAFTHLHFARKPAAK